MKPHTRYLLLFSAVVAAHWGEHILQAVQIWLFHWPKSQALGALGLLFPSLVRGEWLHTFYAVFMVAGFFLLAPGFLDRRAYKWWGIATGIQVFHVFEHLTLFAQALTGLRVFGLMQPVSLVQALLPMGLRPELHLFYNGVVTVPMIVASLLYMVPRPSLFWRAFYWGRQRGHPFLWCLKLAANVSRPLYLRTPAKEKAGAARLVGPRELVAYLSRVVLPTLRQDVEQAVVVGLRPTENGVPEVVGWKVLAVGDASSVAVNAVDAVREVMKMPADGFAFFHNHPTRDSAHPSMADAMTTGALSTLGGILGVRFFDHVIIDLDGDAFSFVGHGVLSSEEIAKVTLGLPTLEGVRGHPFPYRWQDTCRKAEVITEMVDGAARLYEVRRTPNGYEVTDLRPGDLVCPAGYLEYLPGFLPLRLPSPRPVFVVACLKAGATLYGYRAGAEVQGKGLETVFGPYLSEKAATEGAIELSRAMPGGRTFVPVEVSDGEGY